MAHFNREAFAGMMGSLSPGFDARTTEEYWKGLATEERRRGALELYRSGDFEKLEPYRGRLAALDVPVLCLWGENDEFAPVAGAYRFRKEISHAEVVVIEGAGHFVFADAPEGCATAVTRFLDQLKI